VTASTVGWVVPSTKNRRKKMAAKPNKNAPLGQGGRFAAVAKAAGGGKKGAAIAAAAGRKKYGASGMAKLSAKGKRDAKRGK
jgi:hypothetical protein